MIFHVRILCINLHISSIIIQFQYTANSVNLAMKSGRQFIIYILCLSFLAAGTDWRTLNSTTDQLSIEVIFDLKPGEKPEPLTLLIGLPSEELPSLNIRSYNKRKVGFNIDSDDAGVKWINRQKVRQLETATLEI
ncbi:MAG TPA: hypothetical protein QGH36_03500, partial [Candidatus Marinimicrobia bacterium]|nr:hypothetical protein [Candidatus Neomarinimicrobiota bacterium]